MLGISECSFKVSHDQEDIIMENYETFFSKTLENPALNVSRISVYVDKDIHKNIRSDFSSIYSD